LRRATAAPVAVYFEKEIAMSENAHRPARGIHDWKKLSSETLAETRFFKLRADRCELPDGRIMPRYYVMEFPDWVNVVAITDDDQIILVEQYRHASGLVHLEIPGGSTNPGATPEDPEAAARRELLEETGYEPRETRLIASHFPNPAMQMNRMHTYLALGCRKVAEPNLDPFEDLRVKTMPLDEAVKRALSGRIDHSIVAASLLVALPVLGYRVSRI
jgi:8-oxo-dGTP pyrophosphatase MutT (NUDIX family)